MFWMLLRFYCTLLVRSFAPRENEIALPDEGDSHLRRYSRRYRIKRGWVKNLWIGASLLMICFPLLPFIVGLGLLTSFLSFAILDETA
ncbi:hypothetical protein M0G74_06025 [Microbulbifer sp. CAU 1566]|uniref:hypothetical protein n=1 Tax=unclassified Microbulbifer TaxID=2619833 RepID=UPI00135A9A0C|nr:MULTISPECIES: hypothetical protein [unclassified Microbulbifer]MCK7596827.1 hypothetical protein [Microbulbifer sp. CAU 1566]